MSTIEKHTEQISEYLKSLHKVIDDAIIKCRSFLSDENDNSEDVCSEDRELVFLLEVCQPLNDALRFIFLNNPLSKTPDLLAIGEQMSADEYPLSEEELFGMLCEMTEYGLNKLLVEMRCSLYCREDLTEAIRKKDFDAFKTICRSYSVDFSKVSMSFSTINVMFMSTDDLSDIIQGTEASEEVDEEDGDSEDDPIHTSPYYKIGAGFLSNLFCGTEDDAGQESTSMLPTLLVMCFRYLKNFDLDEAKEINRILSDNDFQDIVKSAQKRYVLLFNELPVNTHILLSEEEQAALLKTEEVINPSENNVGKESGELLKGSEVVPIIEELHWPSDEELKGYRAIFNDKEYFSDSIFGMPGTAKVSDVEGLFNVLVSLKVLNDDLKTKLIFLERYTGKAIPGVTPEPIEWKMIGSDCDKAIGYLIEKTAGGKHKFAKGLTYFYYYNHRGEQTMPDREAVATGGKQWAKPARLESSRTTFEKEINRFLRDHNEMGED